MTNVPIKLRKAVLVLVLIVTTRPGCCDGGDESMLVSAARFLVSVGDAMNSVSQGLKNVIEQVKIVENVFTDAIEEDCLFRCPNGVLPYANPYHSPTSNGCGSIGYQIAKDELPVEQLTNCCDDHDICYDTCNEDKDDCDNRFKKCLYRICDKYVGNSKDLQLIKSCKVAAKVMFVGTMALGCRPFKDAQEKACYCRKVSKLYREL